MNHVLVTGGAGLIGHALTKQLLQNGEKVVVLDNLITSNGSNLNELQKNPGFEFIKHDITFPFTKTIINKLSSINYIYHLACPTGVPNLLKLGEEMLKTCSIGTMNILELARKNKANLVFTSSSEVYGDPEIFPQSETYNGNVDSVGFRSTYEEGKRFSESLVMTYVRKHNLDAKIVRVFNTYGAGASKTETRVITRFLKNARMHKPLLIEGKGTQTRTFCYVDDLVNALILISERGKKGEVYNAGGDVEISIAELAKLVLFVTGSKSKIKYIHRPNHDHERRHPDLTKLKALGWKQTTGIYEGLIKTFNIINY